MQLIKAQKLQKQPLQKSPSQEITEAAFSFLLKMIEEQEVSALPSKMSVELESAELEQQSFWLLVEALDAVTLIVLSGEVRRFAPQLPQL